MDKEQFLVEAGTALASIGIDLKALMSDGFDPERPFTEDLFSNIAKSYAFDSNGVATARLVFNIAVQMSAREAKWTATHLPKVRTKFEAVREHSLALQRALQDLNEEDLYVANEATIAQGYASNPETMRLFETEPKPPSASVEWDGNRATLVRPGQEPLNFDELTRILNAIDEAMALSLRAAGKGKIGRREDATLEPLLLTAFQMYEQFTGKIFSLQWHSDNSPISEAACFCVDIVRVVDRKIPSSKIVSAANEVRKLSHKVSNLEEGLDFANQYSKRSR
jgi:hypothetical protein